MRGKWDQSDDTTRFFVAPCQLERIYAPLGIFESDSAKRARIIVRKTPVFQDGDLKRKIGFVFPGSEQISRIADPPSLSYLRYDIRVPIAALPRKAYWEERDWHKLIVTEIRNDTIFGSEYKDFRSKLEGVFCSFPEDSTWGDSKFAYCELYGRYDPNKGEISSVLVLDRQRIRYVWSNLKISQSPRTKVKGGYAYHRANDPVPKQVLTKLSSHILSGGIGSPEIEK